ncbi:MAG: ABC transporter ATP-binding protein [Cyanobacteria bacterium P01_C01_bin.73]
MAQVVLENIYKVFPRGRGKKADVEPDMGATAMEDAAVLRRISLTVEDGEFMVLVGPSGCGKSTLLRLIAGLESLSAGNIWVGDRQVNQLPPKQRDIAMVFQSYALYPHMTVYDNLAFGLRRMGRAQRGNAERIDDVEALDPSLLHSSLLHSSPLDPSPKDSLPSPTSTDAYLSNQSLSRALVKTPRWQSALVTLTKPLPKALQFISEAERLIEQRVRLVAQMLQIEPLLNRLPRQLSGGQKQRVALGRAMARNPQVFLMDEPLSNLDAKLRTETRAQIVNLQRQLGVTTIYVTHDQVEAMTMGDRIAVMNQGQIQQLAEPLTLYHRPANRFVAEFIGSPPMNFIPVQVRSPLVVNHAGFRLTLPGEWEDILRDRDGQRVTLGIRPEHLSLSLPAPKNLPVTVMRTEALGSETYLTARFMDQSLQIRLDGSQTVKPGEDLWLGITSEQIHLFDADSGRSLRA